MSTNIYGCTVRTSVLYLCLEQLMFLLHHVIKSRTLSKRNAKQLVSLYTYFSYGEHVKPVSLILLDFISFILSQTL
jgi:hypothetical protein